MILPCILVDRVGLHLYHALESTGGEGLHMAQWDSCDMQGPGLESGQGLWQGMTETAVASICVVMPVLLEMHGLLRKTDRSGVVH